MELLGISLLASREHLSSSPFRTTEEEGALSVHVDQGTPESKSEAGSDFAALLTFLFPDSSPEEEGKNREQRGSTAFDQGNHVDTLFPQSPEETFPSSPESVPTHDVSSALSSLPTNILVLNGLKESLLVKLQDEEIPQPAGLFGEVLPVDFPGQVTPSAESPDAPGCSPDDYTIHNTADVTDSMAIGQDDRPSSRRQRVQGDALVIEESVLDDRDMWSSSPQLEALRSRLTVLPTEQEAQTQPLVEPEREELLQPSLEPFTLPTVYSPTLLSMSVRFTAAPASAAFSAPSAPPAALVQSTQGPNSNVEHYPAEDKSPVWGAAADTQPSFVTSDEPSRVPIANVRTPLAFLASQGESAALPTLLPSMAPEPLANESPPSQETLLPAATRTMTPAARHVDSLSELPTSFSSQPGVTPVASDMAHGPNVGQREAIMRDAQSLFSLTPQTGQATSVGQPHTRLYPIEHSQIERYGDVTGPALPLEGSAEVQLRFYSQGTPLPEAGEERFTRTHVTSALLSPGDAFLQLSGTGPSLPHTVSPLSQPHPLPGAAVIEQVTEQIVTRFAQGNNTAMLELEPQELGRVHIDLVLQGDQVDVRIITERADISTLIQTHLPELKTALLQHQLELGTVSVDVNARDGERGTSTQDPGWHFGADNGGNGNEPPAQQHDTEQTNRRSPNLAPALQPQGVSVWA